MIAPDEVRKKRIQTCRGCERYSCGICKECGCIMRLKTKFNQAYCPVGKWPEYIPMTVKD